MSSSSLSSSSAMCCRPASWSGPEGSHRTIPAAAAPPTGLRLGKKAGVLDYLPVPRRAGTTMPPEMSDMIPFVDAAREVVELANRIADKHPELDVWEIA